MAAIDTFMAPESTSSGTGDISGVEDIIDTNSAQVFDHQTKTEVTNEEVPSMDILLDEMENNFGWQQIAYNLEESETPSLEDMKTLLEMFRQVNWTNGQMLYKAGQTLHYAKIHDNRVNDFAGFTQ